MSKQFDALIKLGLSPDEANQVLADDKKIDKGEKMSFDLTKEEEKATRKYRQADRKPTTYNFSKRERKPNEAKREIIQVLDEALTDIADDVTVTNVERQIDFELDGVKYRVVLSCPRS